VSSGDITDVSLSAESRVWRKSLFKRNWSLLWVHQEVESKSSIIICSW